MTYEHIEQKVNQFGLEVGLNLYLKRLTQRLCPMHHLYSEDLTLAYIPTACLV